MAQKEQELNALGNPLPSLAEPEHSSKVWKILASRQTIFVSRNGGAAENHYFSLVSKNSS